MSDDDTPLPGEETPSFRSRIAVEKLEEVRIGIFGRKPEEKSVAWRLLARMLDGNRIEKQEATRFLLNDQRPRPFLERAEKSTHPKVKASAKIARTAINKHIGDAMFSAPRPKGAVLSA